MEKFLNVPVFKLLANGTTTSGTANKLTDSSATFQTAGVAVGDIIHNSTDNTYTTVTAVDSETVLSVSTTVPNSKAYFIHSATLSNSQLVSASGVLLVEQASTSTVTIAYDSPSASADVITLTHVPVSAGSEAVRDLVQAKISEAYTSSWTNISHDLSTMPNQVIGISLG